MTFQELLTENHTKPQLVDVLEALADESDYWQKCYDFYLNNLEKPIERMTPRMAKWADKIAEDVLERYLERKR